MAWSISISAGGWAYWVDREGFHKVFFGGSDEP